MDRRSTKMDENNVAHAVSPARFGVSSHGRRQLLHPATACPSAVFDRAFGWKRERSGETAR